MVSGTPNTLAQLALVNDGVGNYYSPLQRNMGGLFAEDVTDLDTSVQPLVVYAAGSLKASGTDYTVGGPGLAIPGHSYVGIYIAWNAPAPAWIASHPYAVNDLILDYFGHIQKCTTAGTAGASVPSWNSSGGTTTDGTVTWTDQGYNPGPTAPITAQFDYYFRMQFESDTQDFEKWAGQLWTIGGANGQGGSSLKFMTSRP
jgi:hypothetical protein